MRECGRPLALAALLQIGLGALPAAAQTIVVRGAPAGSAVEVSLNAKTVGSTTADERGDAVVPASLTEHVGEPEAGLSVFVDVCEKLHRVVLVERGVPPPAQAAGCERRDVIGLFLVRQASNVVVHVDRPVPRVLLIQGRYNLDDPGTSPLWPPAPTGLAPFVGGGFRLFRDARLTACGNVSDCQGGEAGGTYAAGVTYWLSRYLGAEGAFVKPAEAAVEGTGDAFRFNSALDARLVTVAGLVGVPINAVRIYGKVGANHHWATFTTTQTTEDRPITVDGVPATMPGGTQTFELETTGWGWMFGAGLEVWVSRRVNIYAEFGRHWVKGSAADADGTMDEALTSIMAGLKVRLF